MLTQFYIAIWLTRSQWVNEVTLTRMDQIDIYKTTHYNDVIMTTMASQITSLRVVYSTVYSDANQRKHQSSASLAFVWGIHRDRWIPRTKGQLRGKCFHLMTSSWTKTCWTKCWDRIKEHTPWEILDIKIWENIIRPRRIAYHDIQLKLFNKARGLTLLCFNLRSS